jgi:hypothetical protein
VFLSLSYAHSSGFSTSPISLTTMKTE